MDYESLSQLSFTNGEELSKYIKELSKRNGFQVFQHDSNISNRIRFYCKFHQIHKNVKRTKKQGCPFQLNINQNSFGIYKISPHSVFLHSHELLHSQQDIEDDLRHDIYNMKKIGISNFQIIRFIEIKHNVTITQKDISSISDISRKEDNSETNLLQEYMEGKGKCLIFEDSDGLISRLLTVTYEEKDNLKKFGDFLVIDGTTIPNFLEWTIIPISLQGNNGELKSGGIAFAPSENREFYSWLLFQLITFSPQLKGVLSDEDCGICSAMDDFPNLCHILCIKHK